MFMHTLVSFHVLIFAVRPVLVA